MSIVLFTFFCGVCIFGPKHRQGSLLDVLLNPVPGIEFEGGISEFNDFDSLQHQHFNHNIVA